MSHIQRFGTSMMVVPDETCGCTRYGYSEVCPRDRLTVSSALAMTNCLTVMSAIGRFKVSKKAGSTDTNQRILRVSSPPVRALKIEPGALVGTKPGVIVGILRILYVNLILPNNLFTYGRAVFHVV